MGSGKNAAPCERHILATSRPGWCALRRSSWHAAEACKFENYAHRHDVTKCKELLSVPALHCAAQSVSARVLAFTLSEDTDVDDKKQHLKTDENP